jgi:tetratricopeptide (TPR) repeat protein
LSAVARRYYVRALEQLQRGELDAARADFGAALELAPRFAEARVAYATSLARAGDAPRAAQLLRAGLMQETRPRARLLLESALGEVLIASSDYRGAEEAYRHATELGRSLGLSTSWQLHDRLARLRAKTGRFAEALDELLAAARARRG